MFKVKIENSILPAFQGENLRELLIKNGFYINSPCGGNGTCGKCTVTVNGEKVNSCGYSISSDIEVVIPKKEDIFAAFKYTNYDDVRVVLLGQDPYHGPNQAEGLAFSVSNSVIKPPSLKNIFKELESDLKIQFPELNSLKPWTKQGVLLLNSVLTVEEHKPASHKNRGWETFTDEVIKKINEKF